MQQICGFYRKDWKHGDRNGPQRSIWSELRGFGPDYINEPTESGTWAEIAKTNPLNVASARVFSPSALPT